MNWLYYLAEANLYLGVFYLAYCLFLNKETYYQLNRAYLISSCVISFMLPVLQLGALKPVEDALTATNYTIAAPVAHVATPVAATRVTVTSGFTLQGCLWDGYLFGAIVILLTLIIKLYTLFKLMRHAGCVAQGKHKIVYLTGTDVAFSFFNYLFIGTNAAGAGTIIRHELVHIRQRHSADIIFLELLKIINWFNPCIYLVQNSLKAVHEYIADEQTAIYETDTLAYSAFLVNNAYGAGGSSITHSFFNYNLLKKRIIMLNQQRSGSLARLKYLVAAPICAALLCASTLAFSKTYGWVDLAPVTGNLRGKPIVKDTTIKRLKVTKNDVTLTPPVADGDSRPQPPVNKHVTGKGYTYEETGYLVKNITDYRVIITEKNGEQHTYFRNAASLPESRWLQKKYGYTFPTAPIYNQLPPPPPMAPQQVYFPPPVVKPDKKVVKFPPPIIKPYNKAVKFPPPIVKPYNKAVKFPPPIIKPVKFPPPIVKPDTDKKTEKLPPPM